MTQIPAGSGGIAPGGAAASEPVRLAPESAAALDPDRPEIDPAEASGPPISQVESIP